MANNLIALEDYASIRSAGERSGYSEQYIRRLVRDRRLHAVKVGCAWLIEIASLNGYLKEARHSNDKRRGPRRRTNVE